MTTPPKPRTDSVLSHEPDDSFAPNDRQSTDVAKRTANDQADDCSPRDLEQDATKRRPSFLARLAGAFFGPPTQSNEQSSQPEQNSPTERQARREHLDRLLKELEDEGISTDILGDGDLC